MFQTKPVEKIETHILYFVAYFRKSLRLWDSGEQHSRAGGRPQMTIWRRHTARCIPQATNTHS